MKTSTWGRVRNTLQLMLLATAFGVSGISSETPCAADEEGFVAWTAQKAIQLDSLDWRKADPGDLSFLDRALEGKRIVFLGASDHWVSQKYDYRLLLISHLFTKGWHRIGMEMDFRDGARIDRYLETGDPAHLEHVALYGYRGGWREDRDDAPEGFPGIRAPGFLTAFQRQEHAFLGQLRSLNESLRDGSPRLAWFGFDVGLFPCVAYEDADGILAHHEGETIIQEVRRRLNRVKGESRIEEAHRLEELLDFVGTKLPSLKRILGEDQAKKLELILRHEVDNLLFADAAKGGPRTAEWIQGLVRREQRMIWLIGEILADLPADEKIILMGHNLHLSKASETIKLGPIGSPAPTMWPSIGTYLDRRFPGEVYSLWMMYDHGRHGSVLSPEGVADVPSNPESVERLLSKAGAFFILPLDSGEKGESLLHEEQNFLQNGSLASGVIAEQADALFFVREVTELAED